MALSKLELYYIRLDSLLLYHWHWYVYYFIPEKKKLFTIHTPQIWMKIFLSRTLLLIDNSLHFKYKGI